jgi:hypothetical protein
MAHNIHVMLFPIRNLGARSLGSLPFRFVRLPQGLCLAPVTEEIFEMLKHASMAESEEEAFREHVDVLRPLLLELSRSSTVLYAETEYFGGQGGQGAVVIRDGRELMGPVWSADEYVINEGLRHLGVESSGGVDGFDALGLGLHRNSEEWAMLGAESSVCPDEEEVDLRVDRGTW